MQTYRRKKRVPRSGKRYSHSQECHKNTKVIAKYIHYELWGEVADGDLPFTLSLHLISDCRSLQLFPFATGGRLWDDDLIRHCSMSVSDQNTFRNNCLSSFFSFIAFFLKTSTTWFYSRPLGCPFSGFLLLKRCNKTWVPSHGVGLKSDQTLVGYLQRLCATIALLYFQVEETVGQRFYVWVLSM